jgi:hypothetical protein
VAAGELVGDEKAGVVAGAFVGATRVAEADDDGGPLTRPPVVISPPEPVEEGARQLFYSWTF